MISREEIILRLALAAVLGAAIGLERERKDWVAGLRTHMMVCVGATLAMIVSAFGFTDILGTPNVTLDPSRIAAQVISGIGFLGAGTILFLKPGLIRGLTTASGLWAVSAIGLAIGSGMYVAAVAATLLALIILWGLQPLEKRFSKRFKRKYLKITIDTNANPAEIITQLFGQEALDIASFSFDKNREYCTIEFHFDQMDGVKMKTVLSRLQNETAIREIYWNKENP
ncbi:MgtC/SapB family protein [Arachidicoccus ginsenosidivorans]|jgi:putative Mg2+ transporter-C (MgtC) family protein|uniref:MgtC/SapB family protein n=1 Tax=Arachidicoccus ginsenosidivorans TaxID=496057 RepID=A0A5B8VIJ6_9BACT|nr:MgtC/SapB family protein [Arachidicoccus ginsenosidivorans]QEC70436.1 MgtC/SapB family protein [Arachidicoccus ginsenosidivorans]